MKTLNIIFAGTPEFSAQHLVHLINSQYNIIGVLTQPDRPSGRGQNITESPVKNIAKKYNIPIFQPKILLNNSELYIKLCKIRANLMIVVAYGLIIPKKILNIFSIGCINIHASLLPKWRGSTPIQSAILSGDIITGITIIKIDEGIDTGKIIYSETCNIDKHETSKSLQEKLNKISCRAILLVLKNIELGKCKTVVQSQLTTYSYKIKKQDAELNWFQDAITLEKRIRAFNPWPICFFKINNKHIKVWSATIIIKDKKNTHKEGEIILINKNGLQIQTKINILNIVKIQLPGKKIIHAHNLNNSRNNFFTSNTHLI
ncbi:MAG: methionyl-tRNA formyltransferase [Buchnera aphidicola (Floraphis choui)]